MRMCAYIHKYVQKYKHTRTHTQVHARTHARGMYLFKGLELEGLKGCSDYT